jgi:outer membrane murein-binding lipoprotein Lpp
MRKLAIIPSGLVALLVVGGCATRDDIEALRSDIQAVRATDAAAGPDLEALRAEIAALRATDAAAGPPDLEPLRAEIAALRAQIGTTSPARGGDGQDVKALRSDIAALRAQIGTGGAGARAPAPAPAVTPGAKGPPPAGYQKASTLARLPDFMPGLGSLYVRPGTLPAGPYLAYDRDDRLVSTIYMVPIADMTAQKPFERLPVGTPAVQQVDFNYSPGHPGVEVPHYHVVLWHMPEESAKLE